MRGAVTIEQRVKVYQKARILELNRRNHEEHCFDNLYVISIKEYTAYSCPKLHSASMMDKISYTFTGLKKPYACIAFRFPLYRFYYPERKLIMEEMSEKFINEGKREVYELGRVMSDILLSKHEIKGVTTRGGKMTFEVTYDKEVNLDHNEPPGFKRNEQDKPKEVVVENGP
ncbi:hypothetical protein Tco_1055173 [Tanacetum coccineum]|uniref:Uncharacterized protein n=1 Tax=Tanacetum coccineum TaxID=301880 RepID=A0ABQ5H041_9ASTR